MILPARSTIRRDGTNQLVDENAAVSSDQLTLPYAELPLLVLKAPVLYAFL